MRNFNGLNPDYRLISRCIKSSIPKSQQVGPHRTQFLGTPPWGWFSSVQLLSRVWLFVTPWTAVHQASLSITNSWSLLKLMFIEVVMPSNHLILCRPLLLPPPIFPSIRVFSSESVLLISWPRYWSFSISPSHEYSRLISFSVLCFDLFAVQGTLKSLLQHHSSKHPCVVQEWSIYSKKKEHNISKKHLHFHVY